MDIRGKRTVVTGGAGGLGSVMVRQMLQAGAHVAALDIDETSGNALSEQIAEALPSCNFLFDRCDLEDPDAISASLAALIARWGGIDVLINNAAIYPSKPFADYSIQEYRQVHRVNVEAAVVATKSVVEGMKAASWGRIINISSITFFGGFANIAPYIMSKGGLVGLTRALATELGAFGITVNAISPGAFPTAAETIHPDPQGYNQFVLDQQAIKRRGEPKDVAHLAMFLASNESSFITGQNINCDGGWVMQ